MCIQKSLVAVAASFVWSFAHALTILPVTTDPGGAPNGPVKPAAALKLDEVQVGAGSAGLALDRESRKAFVSNYSDGTLSIVDLQDGGVEVFPVGTNPRRILFNAALKRIYIINDTTPGTVTVFDATTKQVVATIAVGKRPRTLSADFQAGEIYVANRGSNSVSVIDTESNAVIATVSVGSDPFMGDVDTRHGRIYVISQLDRVVHVIDQRTKTVVAQVRTGRMPNAATVDESTGKVYVNNAADRTVDVLDMASNSKKTIANTGAGSTFGSISSIQKRYYLPNQQDFTVTIIDTEADEIVKVLPVGASPQQVVVDSAGGDLYVVNRLNNSVTVVDARTELVSGTLSVGENPWRVAVAMDHVFTLNENGSARDSISIVPKKNTLGETAIASEFHHGDFDHYFHTVGDLENRLLLDGQRGNDWNRTYEFFRVWTKDGPNRVNVCRFFSDAFAPRSSHFYTPDGMECDSLKADSIWKYEESSYFVELPDANGECRSGTVPIYRVYNNGIGGAPNHRIVGNKEDRDAMVAKGWVAEGTGPDVVVACGPSLRGFEL